MEVVPCAWMSPGCLRRTAPIPFCELLFRRMLMCLSGGEWSRGMIIINASSSRLTRMLHSMGAVNDAGINFERFPGSLVIDKPLWTLRNISRESVVVVTRPQIGPCFQAVCLWVGAQHLHGISQTIGNR